MTEQSEMPSEKSEPKDISTIQPQETEAYLNVPGWRGWARPRSRSFDESKRDRLYREAFEKAIAKPLALEVPNEKGKAHDLFLSAANKIGIPFILISSSTRDGIKDLYLEPLSQEEMDSMSKRKKRELIPPEDLRKALVSENML